MNIFNIKAVIFDLDLTLIRNGNLFDVPVKSRDIVRYFYERGMKLAMATMNPFGYMIPKETLSMFDTVECIPLTALDSKNKMVRYDKRPMYKKIHDTYKREHCILPCEILVFDDLIFNFVVAKKMGMKAVMVDGKQLITWKDVQNGIHLFDSRLKRSSSAMF